jgi:hypothetical protein
MQAAGTSVSLTTRIDDHDDICRVVQLYLDGAAKGDVSKLKEAFHPDARMFGEFMGRRVDVPIAELFRMSETNARGHRQVSWPDHIR